jgi:REP element-mobilizing transposase RayT
VTLRGNHRQPIFFNDTDRDLLDSVVAKVCETAGVRIHAYCWMTNHLHLLAQVSDIPLGRTILRIASQYARKVQARLSTTGHLFERRYHCILVDAERYLLTLVPYIHLNPVRGGLVKDPIDYPWSSHGNYLGRARPGWVTTHVVLNTLGATRDSAIARYRMLMDTAGNERWGTGNLRLNPNFGDVLGDDEFARRASTALWRPRCAQSLDMLIEACGKRFGVSSEQLASIAKSHNLAVARAWLAHETVAGRVASISTVARRLARTEGSLRQLMARYPRASWDAK